MWLDQTRRASCPTRKTAAAAQTNASAHVL